MTIPHVGAFLRPNRRLAILLRVSEAETVLTPEEARRVADQLLNEAAYCENWQAVIDRQHVEKP